MIRVHVEGVGIVGPGFTGWDEARAVLRGDAPYAGAPVVVRAPRRLPAAEARRAGQPVRLALAAADEAFTRSGLDPAPVATVFSSSSGDGDNVHEILQILASAEREVSPTRFHNSVHNAAAGYWSIATGSREPSTSLCAYDWSFAAGLLEIASQIAVESRTVALVAYDHPYPEPLHAKRQLGGSFAVALVAAGARSARTLAALDIELQRAPDEPDTAMDDAALESLRRAIPAARALPLLAALASGSESKVVLDYAGGARVHIGVIPC